MKFADINGDGSKEIIASGESGIFAINDKGVLLWSNFVNTIHDMIAFQYDNDKFPEFAVSNGLDVDIYDNNGSYITGKNMKVFSSVNLPIASLGSKIASYHQSDVTGVYHAHGIELTDDYDAFYDASDIPGYGLASIDSNGDGIHDTLFGLSDRNVTFSLDKNLNQIWKKEIELSNDDYLSYIWAGKLKNGYFVELVSSNDGYLFELNKQGKKVWSQKLDSEAGKIVHDKDGGFLIATNFRSSFFPATQNTIYKVNENSGSVEWMYSFKNNLTRDITQDNHKIAAGFNGDIKILNENGTISQEINATSYINNTNYLFVNSLKYGTLGSKSGLFVGTQDIDRIYNGNKKEKIYTGGTLVYEVASGDVDGDGKDEIAVTDRYRLYLYYFAGKLLWSKMGYSFYSDSRNKDINFADVNGDGKDELIVKSADQKFTVLDSKGDVLWDKNIDPYLVYLYDFDGDGAKDIFVAYSKQNSEVVQVFSGKDGTLLHDYGISDTGIYYLKVLNINGGRRLYYYSDYSMHWIDLISTFASGNSVSMNSGTILSQYKDFNGDGNQDMAISLAHNSTSTSVYLYDLSKSGTALIRTVNLENQYQIKQIKFFDYNGDGTYEVIAVCNEGVYLYNLNGALIWKFEMVDEFGDNRSLGDVKIVGNQLIVSGKEIYILDKNGHKLQEISADSYMSSEGYFLPTTLAKTGENSLQLVFGAMGIYSYGGFALNTSSMPNISYKAGWNLVASPVNKSISLNQFKNLTTAWKYQNNKWYMYSNDDVAKQKAQTAGMEQFDAIAPKQGVWIKSTKDGKFTVDGVKNTFAILKNGWNLTGGVKTTVGELHAKYPNADIILKYTSNGWKGKSYNPTISLNTLQSIEANEGFWIHVK
jgi:hypothetical protein